MFYYCLTAGYALMRGIGAYPLYHLWLMLPLTRTT